MTESVHHRRRRRGTLSRRGDPLEPGRRDESSFPKAGAGGSAARLLGALRLVVKYPRQGHAGAGPGRTRLRSLRQGLRTRRGPRGPGSLPAARGGNRRCERRAGASRRREFPGPLRIPRCDCRALLVQAAGQAGRAPYTTTKSVDGVAVPRLRFRCQDGREGRCGGADLRRPWGPQVKAAPRRQCRKGRLPERWPSAARGGRRRRVWNRAGWQSRGPLGRAWSG